MKIVVVEPSGKGGMIHYAWQLCQAMQERGASVTLITDRNCELEGLSHSFMLKADLRLWDPKPSSEAGSLLFRRLRRVFRALLYYREWLRIILMVRRLQPDVVQLGDVRFATDLFPIRALRAIAPVVADICHNVHPFSGGAASKGSFGISRLEKHLYEKIYSQFDVVFVHYDVNSAEFARTFPSSATRVVTIVHGNEQIFRDLASPESTAGDLRRDLRLTDSQRVILFFGTLSAYKGLDLLLDVFEQVKTRAADAVLILAGYPTASFDADTYREDARRRGVDQHLRIVGRYIATGDVHSWMELADVTVFPYRSIYQSGALQLAQTFGAPIVATRVGAMPEVIRDGKTGLLVEPDDAEALTEAVVRLLKDDDLAQRLGGAARADAENRFSWSGVAQMLLDRYETLIEERRS